MSVCLVEKLFALVSSTGNFVAWFAFGYLLAEKDLLELVAVAILVAAFWELMVNSAVELFASHAAVPCLLLSLCRTGSVGGRWKQVSFCLAAEPAVYLLKYLVGYLG